MPMKPAQYRVGPAKLREIRAERQSAAGAGQVREVSAVPYTIETVSPSRSCGACRRGGDSWCGRAPVHRRQRRSKRDESEVSR